MKSEVIFERILPTLGEGNRPSLQSSPRVVTYEEGSRRNSDHSRRGSSLGLIFVAALLGKFVRRPFRLSSGANPIEPS